MAVADAAATEAATRADLFMVGVFGYLENVGLIFWEN